MKLIRFKIKDKLHSLKQEELYMKTLEYLGSSWNGYTLSDARVTNHKAHAVNMKIHNYLEVYIKRTLKIYENGNFNLKFRMKAQEDFTRLINLGY